MDENGRKVLAISDYLEALRVELSFFKGSHYKIYWSSICVKHTIIHILNTIIHDFGVWYRAALLAHRHNYEA